MSERTAAAERIERGVGTAVWRQIALAMEQAIRRGSWLPHMAMTHAYA